ncbi:MAG: AMP-binding protein [Chloroflexi bacterium]|nr:AMP-binding protein [Chloroflexota bacterium]
MTTAPGGQEFAFGGEIVWRPTAEQSERSQLYQFMRAHGIATFDELLRRSTADIAWFWDAVLKQLQIEFYRPYTQVVDLSRGPEWARWCVDGLLNVVHNAVDKRQVPPDAERHAIRWEGEEGATRTVTYGELYAQVNRAANALRALGIGKGDAVGLYMPLVPEIVVAYLAIAKIGGIVLPLFSGFGAGAIASRLNDAGAKAIFSADGMFRRGKVVPMKPVADEALAQCPTVQHCIVLKRAGNAVAWQAGRDHDFTALLAAQSAEAATERTAAEDPFMIIYTSGTTGRPKGALHTHVGFPTKCTQDMVHGLDLRRDDVFYWMTDMGWMMGPLLVLSSLLTGATMFLYDGAPDHPGPDRIWSLVERHGITLLGVSPTFVRGIMRHGAAPARQHSLSSLRAFASTGEPWNPTPWLWLFNEIGEGRVPIMNYSGGTEISGGILISNWLTPIKPCSFGGPLPGIAADVVGPDGKSLRGEVGELVIRQPWIGMTRGFWRDPERYLQTYWSRWPGTWVHGDWAAIDDDGLWYILGRSDDVIKVAGKRLGPAEVESALVRNPAVAESAAIGVPDEVKGEAVVCFAMLKPGATPSETLKSALRDEVAAELGKPMAPKEILFVNDLPRTRNAKIMRRVIRAVYLGRDPGDVSSLENPSAVDEIRRVATTPPGKDNS